jgi:hypothetical protein
MFYKTTKSLFRGKYQHKIVLVTSNAGLFRNGAEGVLTSLLKTGAKTFMKAKKDDSGYASKLANYIAKMEDYDIRVESPWISIYTNNIKDINYLIKLDKDNVKYVSSPDSSLEVGTVVMPKMPFDYRITLGKTTKSHPEFIEWASAMDKLRLTKSCIRELERPRSWGGTHFYVKGDNVLLMAKMHLGGSISKIERIVKPSTKV